MLCCISISLSLYLSLSISIYILHNANIIHNVHINMYATIHMFNICIQAK